MVGYLLSLEKRKMFNSKFNQLLFIKFPILFPLAYIFILYVFPSYEKELILITILLLAEPHFGVTWPFFLNKTNFHYIKEKKIELLIIPILICIFSLIGFFFFRNLFFIVFFAANIYHVTRQSFGICKIYCKNEHEFRFQEKYIYLLNAFLFLIALFRFYLPIINSENLFFLNIFFLSLLSIISFIYLFRFKFSENYLTFLTGSIIFYPVCFVDNPIHVILMGVTMHYTQYLYFTNKVNLLRIKDKYDQKKFFNKIIIFISIFIIYALIMTYLSSFGKSDNELMRALIIIPILGQMLHFYIDSQIWKFSIKHNRDNVLYYLKKILN